MKSILAVLVIAAGVAAWYWFSRPQPVAARPQQPTRHLAPAGTYFLTQRVSFPTDAGVISYAEGTRVHAVAENGGKMHVRAEEHEFDVEKAKLTNDLDIAAAAARRDAGTRKKYEAWAREQQAALAHQRQTEAEAIERAEASRRAHAPPPMGSTPNPLDRGPYHQHP